jgi:hypothetical protein
MLSAAAQAESMSMRADGADAQYCLALTKKYADSLAVTNLQRQDPQAIGARAGMEQCQAGNTAVGIPLLKSSLLNAGIDLPPREAPNFIRTTHGHSKGG